MRRYERRLLFLFLFSGALWGGTGAFSQAPDTTIEIPPPETVPEERPPSENPAHQERDPSDEEGYHQVGKLARAIEIIRQNYVDPDKISYEHLINSALEGMLSDLDPHCQYLYPKAFEQMQREQTNTYDGVGITIAPKERILAIVSVREDGPAAISGVLPGDRIIQIGDIMAKDVGLSEAIRLLRGAPGEVLRLTLSRPSTNEIKEFEIVRQVIQKDTVKDPMLLHHKLAGDHKIGYVRLLQFNEPSAGELATALNKLEDQGMEAFIFDLRNNPGGLLRSAIEILGEFVPTDTLVLTTRGRVDSQTPPPFRTPGRKERERDYPMAVLVNHASASASEIVSGALQDLRRAVIVGETTFGKGSVQTVIPLDGGAAMRLTTAKYYTPSERTIHENGVTPNIISTLTPSQEAKLMKWYRANSLNDAKPEDLADVGDRQLERAVDVLKGLMAYRHDR